MASLAMDCDAGKAVEVRPDLRDLLMNRSGKCKDGHIAVYSIYDAEAAVEILHVFHTKQDWQNML